MSGDTKERLLAGAITAIHTHGIAGVSARTIAAAAGANQALIFYHFGGVDDLLAAACTAATAARVEHYADRFAGVTTMRELLEVGRELQAEERRLGNLSVLAQLLAGAQNDPKLGPPVAAAFQLWIDQIEAVLRRLLAGSPFVEVMDVPGLARTVAAAFVGIQLFEGVDEAGARHALDALEQLAVLVEVVDELGPVARRALRAKLNRAVTRRTPLEVIPERRPAT
jgi:AcrR family transcriptional regulator